MQHYGSRDLPKTMSKLVLAQLIEESVAFEVDPIPYDFWTIYVESKYGLHVLDVAIERLTDGPSHLPEIVATMTNEHMREGEAYTADWNPVALAIRDAFMKQFPDQPLEKVIADEEHVGIYLPQKHYEYTCRPELKAWMDEFDSTDEELRPISIKLSVGEAFAMEDLVKQIEKPIAGWPGGGHTHDDGGTR